MTIVRDAAGRDGKRSNRKWNAQTSQWGDWETIYFVYSSVFGKALCEVGPTGKKKRTFVSANGRSLARQVVDDQDAESVSWEHTDASGQSVRMIAADGTPTGADTGSAEYDALGNNVGLHGSLSDPRNSDTYASPFNRPPVSADAICERQGFVGQCDLVELITRGQTFFSEPSRLPVQAAPGSARTGRRYDAVSMHLYERSVLALYEGGTYEARPGDPGGGEDACVGGVCPDVVTVRANPYIFIYVPPVSSGVGNSFSRLTQNKTDCEIFVGLLVSAVEFRRDWVAAGVRIGVYFSVQTHRYLEMASTVVTGFQERLTRGGQNSDVYRHVTLGIASMLLDGVGLISGADSFVRQDLGISAGGSEAAREASKEGNRAGESAGALISRRISGDITGLSLSKGISRLLCK
jgi:hypothetical protein